MAKDFNTTLTLECLKCGHVTESPFRYDSDCGELIALDSSGENCEVCKSNELEEVR